MAKATTGLIESLRKMLLKNCNLLSAEEVEDLEEVIECLVKLQNLEKTNNKNPDPDDSLKLAIKMELVKIAGLLFRFLLNPEMMKTISDLLN